VMIQVYVALIASLLLSAWTQQKPSKRVFELICLYFAGWVHEAELPQQLERHLRPKQKRSKPG
jgi:hypothetical protein